MKQKLKIEKVITGEIHWLKIHNNKISYKHRQKLKEYVENRIDYLEKLQCV